MSIWEELLPQHSVILIQGNMFPKEPNQNVFIMDLFLD